MPITTIDAVAAHVAELAGGSNPVAAVEALIQSVGADRRAVEAARDQVAAHLHRHIDDFEATATLTLLNQALASIPIVDPMDWRVRWAKHRKP
jgi:hypothetical protein